MIEDDDLIYIENVSKRKVLEITNDVEVILRDWKHGKDEQLWKKGEPNTKGFFTLIHSKVQKVMTASADIQTSSTARIAHIESIGLEIIGNIDLRWIV